MTTHVRHDAILRDMVYKRLQDFPKMRAEAIAKHYASLASIALQLLHIIEATRYAPPTENMEHAECAIEYLMKQIQHAHAADFGIPLDWPNAEVSRPYGLPKQSHGECRDER